MQKKRFLVLSSLIFIAAISRIIPHFENFTPMGAIALFGAAYFADKKWAYIVPLIAMWLSDLIVNNILYAWYYDSFVFFTEGFLWVYVPFVLIIFGGTKWFSKISTLKIFGGAIGATLIFFLVSNFGVWTTGLTYPTTFGGLMSSYAAGLPFLKNSLFANLVYSGLLFGVFEWAKSRIPELKTATS